MRNQGRFLQDDDGLDIEERNERKTIIESLNSQWNHPGRKKFLIIKIIVVIIGLTLLILNSSHNFIHKTGEISCFQDVVQDWALPITKYLKNHENSRHSIIILSSMLLDISMTSLYVIFLFYGESLRLFYTVFPFYVIRGLTQRIFAIKFPAYFIFDDPGFFSISVPYFKTNDFFFSGHVGICTIFFLEFRRRKFRVLQYISFFAVILNFFTLLVTRGHFIIDLACGMVSAHYIFHLGLWIEGSTKKSSNPCVELLRARESEDCESNEEEEEDENYYAPKSPKYY